MLVVLLWIERDSKYCIFGHLTCYVIFGELITPIICERKKAEKYREKKKIVAPEVRLGDTRREREKFHFLTKGKFSLTFDPKNDQNCSFFKRRIFSILTC